MSGHRFGCNTCGATFDNPESHDCKDERIKKLESQVRELERQNEDYEALGMKHIELQNKVRELEDQKLSASASCYKTCSELSDRIGELQKEIKLLHEFNDLNPEDDWRYNFKWWKQEKKDET